MIQIVRHCSVSKSRGVRVTGLPQHMGEGREPKWHMGKQEGNSVEICEMSAYVPEVKIQKRVPLDLKGRKKCQYKKTSGWC